MRTRERENRSTTLHFYFLTTITITVFPLNGANVVFSASPRVRSIITLLHSNALDRFDWFLARTYTTDDDNFLRPSAFRTTRGWFGFVSIRGRLQNARDELFGLPQHTVNV